MRNGHSTGNERRKQAREVVPHAFLASGGTLFANALSMAGARVAFREVMTEAAYEHAARLGEDLADGIEQMANDTGLGWWAHRLYQGVEWSRREGWT